MSYYKAMLRKDTLDPLNPARRHCTWHDLIFIAQNKGEAIVHAKQVARDRGMVFCHVTGLNKSLGERLIQREEAVQPVETPAGQMQA